MRIFDSLDLTDPGAVCDIFAAGLAANLGAACRKHCTDEIQAPGRLIATGDIHDNPLHLARLLHMAGMTDPDAAPRAHLTLHEIIHPERLLNGMDFSYRALARVAAIKAAFPEHAHTLLANHEMAQMIGAGIVKNGVRVVEAFDEGLDYTFGDRAPDVRQAVADFIRSMPLALRCHTRRGDILCSHSLPGPAMMARFDPDILNRDLTDDDYLQNGSAYMMVWGRRYDAEQLEDLVERWGVSTFILGHEHVDTGCAVVPPNAIVLNSDHDRGVCLPIDLSDPITPAEAPFSVVPLASIQTD